MTKETITIGSINILSDLYIPKGYYPYLSEEMKKPGARVGLQAELIQSFNADVVAVQEADEALYEFMIKETDYRCFYTPRKSKTEGLMTLVSPDLIHSFQSFETKPFNDSSGRSLQLLRLGSLAIANVHLVGSAPGTIPFVGVEQAETVVHYMEKFPRAIILGDINSEPGEETRNAIEVGGYLDVSAEAPTVYANGKKRKIDAVYARGIGGTALSPIHLVSSNIPNTNYPSDHIEVLVAVKRCGVLI